MHYAFFKKYDTKNNSGSNQTLQTKTVKNSNFLSLHRFHLLKLEEK